MKTKNKSPLTKIIIALFYAAIVIILNGLYFEYCVSRECPTFLIVLASFALTFFNLFMLRMTVKEIINLLNKKK
jgi:hypothetical protein